MANKRRIRPEAEIDLDSIWSFIAADNTKAADAVIDRITDTFDLLLAMPLAGRALPEFGDNLRSIVVGNYVVFYATLSGGVDTSSALGEISTKMISFNLTPATYPSPDHRDGSSPRGR